MGFNADGKQVQEVVGVAQEVECFARVKGSPERPFCISQDVDYRTVTAWCDEEGVILIPGKGFVGRAECLCIVLQCGTELLVLGVFGVNREARDVDLGVLEESGILGNSDERG